MKPTTHLLATLGCCALMIGSAAAQMTRATGKIDIGQREFEASCASCHGKDGKGKGILVEFLRRSPPDLTLMARNNGGNFPIGRLYEVIDGRGVAAHGTRDMPVWGMSYRIRDGEYHGELPYDPEALVRARILVLLEYLNGIQAR